MSTWFNSSKSERRYSDRGLILVKAAPTPTFAAAEGCVREFRWSSSPLHENTRRVGTLDLKRLYWNTRPFRGGKRRGRCPYEHLRLKLSNYGFRNLLRDEMTTAIGEAKAKANAARHKKCQIVNL